VGDAEAGPGQLAVRLRRFREAAALTQEELAARAGLSGKAVGALERGERRRPYPHTVRALAEALGLGDDDRAALVAAASGPAEPTPAAVPAVPAAVALEARTVTSTATQPFSAPVPALVGRSVEHERAVALLRRGEVRLLTLTGPGGVGKTRLALEVARTLAADLPGAVTVVELAPVADPALVLPAVARAVGGVQLAGPAVPSLAAALGDRQHLLVLDNLEHVLDVAGDVADLLARCPGLLVLATSRAALRVRAEQVLPLDPLPLPATDDVEAVGASPAVRMFLDRAAAAGATVDVTAGTAASLAAVARRLDGLPLALELAAAHARFLAPSALLEHLDQAVGSPRSRDLPERQRTVRATLDWSHGLLTGAEQVLLRRLSVLPGPFSLSAATAVAGADVDVLTALAGLVEQSLLVPVPAAEPSAEPRYRALEPVRQYASAHLAGAGEADLVADRAATFYAALATDAHAGLRGPEQAAWLDRLGADHTHLGTAFDRLLRTGRLSEAAQVAGSTWLYWALRGNVTEGLTRFDAAVAAIENVSAATVPVDDADRAGLLLAVAGLRYAAGDLAGMAAPADAAVAAARRAAATSALVEALAVSAFGAVFRGELDAAGPWIAEVLELAGPGDRWARVGAVIARSQLVMATGDLAGAAAILDGAERAARELASPFTLATVLNMRSSVAQALGDDEASLGHLVEAADLAVEVGTTWTLVYTLPGLAVVAARRGRAELAAELFAAGPATAEAASLALSFPPDLAAAQRRLQEVQSALGPDAFERAWDRGRRSTLADVPALARRITAPA
jgi:predicted ATPase/transcriptional regulator with XRE-family HTH domain